MNCRALRATIRCMPSKSDVDWLDHQLAARELLKLNVADTHLIVEHEYPKARIQDRERLKPICRLDRLHAQNRQAAACMFALQSEVWRLKTYRFRVSVASIPILR
jgi:hypothetical protein